MSHRAKTILLLIVDLSILVISLTFVTYIRSKDNHSISYLIKHYDLFTYIFPFWILTYFIEGLYTLKTYNPASLPISLIRSTFLSVFISIIVIYLLPPELERVSPKTNLALTALASLPLMYGWRKLFFTFFSHDSRLRRTILIGSKDTLNLVQTEINKKPHLGYKILSAEDDPTFNVEFPKNIELIAVERNLSNNALYLKIFKMLESGIEVIDLAKFAEKISGKIPLHSIDESWFIEYCGHQESQSYDILKSLIDRFISILLLIALIPLSLIVLPLLFIAHGSPVFFRQTRIGANNQPFTLLKLRTMVTDAEKDGVQWAKPKDARITPLGSILRKTRIDELPQLVNILKGEMSLVGPRPERPEIIEKELKPHIPYYNLRHLVKPGVTGWAQVTFRYGFSQQDSKEKLQYDLFYIKNRSLWLDLLVLIKTIKTIITGAGQ